MKIKLFELEFEPDYVQAFQAGCKEILETSFLAEGKYTRQFEEEFAKFSGCKYGICLTSCTAALEIALKAVGVEGQEVIIPSNTFFATAVAVRNAGGILKLVDMEDQTFAICPDKLRQQITPKTKVVILVHIGGIISSRIAEIVQICKEHNIVLIEDAAHAHGSKRGKYIAGAIGDIACFSFFPTKVMTTGEGGMITTNKPNLYNTCCSLKNFGRKIDDGKICVNDFGNNYKVSEFTSLMGVLEMGRVQNRIARRQHLSKLYKQNLPNYEVFYDEEIYNSCYKAIVKTPKNASGYGSYCERKDIALTGTVYNIPVHEQPLWKDKFNPADFPVTNHFSKHHICPPLYPELSEEQIIYTCNVLGEIHENQSR